MAVCLGQAVLDRPFEILLFAPLQIRLLVDVHAVTHELGGVFRPDVAERPVRVETGRIGVAQVVARWAAPFRQVLPPGKEGGDLAAQLSVAGFRDEFGQFTGAKVPALDPFRMSGHHRAVSGLGVCGDLDPTFGVGSGFEAEDLVVAEAVGSDQTHRGFPGAVVQAVDKGHDLLIGWQVPGVEDLVGAEGALRSGAVEPIPFDAQPDLVEAAGCGDPPESFATVIGGAEHPPLNGFRTDGALERLELSDVPGVVRVDGGAAPGEVLPQAEGERGPGR